MRLKELDAALVAALRQRPQGATSVTLARLVGQPQPRVGKRLMAWLGKGLRREEIDGRRGCFGPKWVWYAEESTIRRP